MKNGRTNFEQRLRWLGKVLLVALLAFGLLSAAPAVAEPVKVRLATSGILPTVFYGMFYSKKKDLLKHYGKSYVVEPTIINATSIIMQAIAANEIDMGFLAVSSLGNAIKNAKLDIKVVADTVQEGLHGRAINRWVALESSGIRSVKDLKGKNIGVLAYGTAVDLIVRVILKKNGLDPKRDVNIVQASFPSQGPMMRAGKLDVADLVVPFTVIEEAKGGIRTIFTGPDAMGRHQVLMMVAKTSLLEKNRAAMMDFFEDWVRAWRWFIDPKNKQEVLKMASSLNKIPAKKLGWYLTKEDYWRDPWARPDIAALQKNLNTAAEMGFIPGHIDLKNYTDLSFIEEAKRRLSK